VFLSIAEFIGHFHPLVVHLPIGILLMALLLQWLSAKEKYSAFYAPVPFLLLIGMISAILSCISGYLLSISDDYNKEIVGWHQWMGISVAIISILLYCKERKIRFALQLRFLPLLLFVLIMITGHLGGALTHGSDYLSAPFTDIFSDTKETVATIKPLANAQEAVAYTDVVKPIFQTRCYSCHGPNKQKGKLRLDDSASIMKGGEDGKIIDIQNVDESELIKRILLPVDNDDHMPPREKPQPTENQVTLLHWWLSTGADFNKKVKDLNQPENIKPVLLALQEVPDTGMKITTVPIEPVEQAGNASIERLKEQGIVVFPVAKGSNYLSANFVTDSMITDEDINSLLAIKKQLIWLKMGFTNVDDQKMSKIKELSNLTRLSIEHTSISDKGIAELKSNKKLKYLNIVGTNVSAKGLLQLKDLKELQNVFVYRAKFNPDEWTELKTALPTATIDTGNYFVPTFASDTSELKEIIRE
jgi:uncharacterized membrane protein/mono/diheme cytochrome c family protein